MAEHDPITHHLQPDKFSSVIQVSGIRALWLATVTNQLSFGMQQVILGWVVLTLTQSSGMVGLAFALRSAPNLVVGFAAGAISDRLDRRTLMRLAVLGLALVTLLMAWGIWMDRVAVWHVLLYAVIVGVLRAFEMTARQAYVYDIAGAKNAVQGLALNAIAQRVGGALGALIAGVILEWWGASAAFLVMSLCYGMAGALLYVLRRRGAAAPTTAPEPLWQNVKSYARALRTHPILRSLIISTAAVEMIGFSHQVMLPVLAKDVMHIGAAGLGVLTAFRFIGGVMGATLLTTISRLPQHGRLLLVVLGLFGVGEVLLSQVTQFWLAVACVTAINVMASATDILHQALLQRHVANTQRGRAMGSWIVGTGAAPIGHLEIGYLAGVAGVSAALLLNGSALIALPFLLAWAMPQLRRL
ncbi:MAG: MFS transporter [Candidatus Tectomicrobia bacterium]|nr:MFS transporter [Candidatus Tectomicrobia bacterium]